MSLSPRTGPVARAPDPRGIAAATGAYALWGLFPLYIVQLAQVGALEVVAHRALWSFLLCLVLVAVTRRHAEVRTLLRTPRTLVTLALAAVFLAANWSAYVLAVSTGRTLDAALAYYMNPLVTVVLGVVLLRERLRHLQWVAVGLGTVSVVVLTATAPRPPWLSLVIALSWSCYGLAKKRIGGQVTAVSGMLVETAALVLPAVGYLLALHALGTGSFLGAPLPSGPGPAALSVLLVGTGLVTTLPLVLFAAASRRLPLVVIGLLQFATPTMQFLVAVLVFGEPMPAGRWIGFTITWAAMAVLAVDLVRQARRSPGR